MTQKYITPQPVVVVHPRHDTAFGIAAFATRIVVGTAFTFLFALVAWWLGPIVFPGLFDLTYWQTFALLYLARVVIPRPASFRYQSDSVLGQPRGD